MAQKYKALLLTKELRKIVDHLPSGSDRGTGSGLAAGRLPGGFRRSEIARLTHRLLNLHDVGLQFDHKRLTNTAP